METEICSRINVTKINYNESISLTEQCMSPLFLKKKKSLSLQNNKHVFDELFCK